MYDLAHSLTSLLMFDQMTFEVISLTIDFYPDEIVWEISLISSFGKLRGIYKDGYCLQKHHTTDSNQKEESTD